MAFNTGNPLGSTDPRDFSDNSENLDRAVNNAASATWTDRFGNSRTTLAGQVGYTGTGTGGAIESYSAGLVLSTYNTIILYSGEFYRPSASATLPYTTTATTPDVDSNLVAVGDAVLRQDLANSTAGVGSDLVAHTGTSDTVTEALDKRTIYVGSVAELEALSLPVGTAVYLTEEGRAGEGVIRTGIPPSDPLNGVYIFIANGNYWERSSKFDLTPEMFGRGDGSTTDSEAIEAMYTLASTISTSVIIPDNIYVGDVSIPHAPTTCYGFIEGLVSVSGAGVANIGEMRCSSLYVEGPSELKSTSIYIDGSAIVDQPGISTVEVSRVVIDNLEIKNTDQSGTSFSCTDGELLQIGVCKVNSAGRGGLNTAGTMGSTYAYATVDIESLIVEDCGGASTGSNQLHSFYLSSCESADIRYFRVRNQTNGYGIKVGSSTEKQTGHVHIGRVDVEGIQDQGFVTITEPCKSFTMGDGNITAVLTYGLQATHGDYINTGKVKFIEKDNTGPKGIGSEPAIRIRGDVSTLDISGSTFQGWLDGATRRGIYSAVSLDSGKTLGRLISVGSYFAITNFSLVVVPATSEITSIQFSSPEIGECLGIFFVEGDIVEGFIGNIYAKTGSTGGSFVVPPRNPKLKISNVTLEIGGSVIRLNESDNGRLWSPLKFEESAWRDPSTGVATVPAQGDYDKDPAAISSGYIGRVYDAGVWKNYGAIV